MGFTCILSTNIVLDGRYWDFEEQGGILSSFLLYPCTSPLPPTPKQLTVFWERRSDRQPVATINIVKPVLEITCIKRPPALRDHCSDTTNLHK